MTQGDGGEDQTSSGVGRRGVKAPAKRAKTGGRAKKPIEQQLAEAKMRSEIAQLDDDTLLPTELAALYLCTSAKQLAEMRAPAKAADKKRGVEGPPIFKVIDKGAVGQNQGVQYLLADLRAYIKKNSATTSHQIATNAGLYGFVTAQLPFFAEPAMNKAHARDILIGSAWDLADSRRERLFKDLVEERSRIVWLSPMDAAASRWSDLDAHNALAAAALGILRQAIDIVQSAKESTEIRISAGESSTA
jgi:hypothetical protein